MHSPTTPHVLLPLTLHPQAPPLGARLYSMGGQTMGTTWRVMLAAPPNLPLQRLHAGVEAQLALVNAQMSTWLPNSALCQFGRRAAGQWLRLPPEFAHVMRHALLVAQASAGAFDPTAGPLVDAWGFGPVGRYDTPGFSAPTAEKLAGLNIGWQGLRIDQQDRLFQPGGLALDLSAIAKGFAVDAVSAYLQACMLPHHLVEVGGELRGQGVKPDGQPWWVGVEPPRADCALPRALIALHQLSVATSGDYRRQYDDHGQSRSHTIDPRTRQPVAHGLASVTVLHTSCMMADAWSTAVMVLGPQAGLQLAEAQGLAARLVWPDDQGRWQETWTCAAQTMLTDNACERVQ